MHGHTDIHNCTHALKDSLARSSQVAKRETGRFADQHVHKQTNATVQTELM